jgi:uncharacterized protein YndB with AHSA1/START domain
LSPGSVRRAVAELEVRVGGQFRIVMEDARRSYEHFGEYLVVDRPRRLAFT